MQEHCIKQPEDSLIVLSDHKDQSKQNVMSSYMNFNGLKKEIINLSLDNLIQIFPVFPIFKKNQRKLPEASKIAYNEPN